MTVHLRVTVPVATLRNKQARRIIEATVGPERVVGTREEDGLTLVWLELTGHDDPRPVRITLLGALEKAAGTRDGILAEPYHPRPDRRTRDRPGHAWRGRAGRAVIPSTRPQEATGP